MFYQGKIVSNKGTWYTPNCNSREAAEMAVNEIVEDKNLNVLKITLEESNEKFPEFIEPAETEKFKYRYFKTDIKTGQNKVYVMESEIYDESCMGMWNYRRRVDFEHQDNISGLMIAYSGQAIGYDIVYC
jgi:hypothetical protein